jgi:hypothetical protein
MVGMEGFAGQSFGGTSRAAGAGHQEVTREGKRLTESPLLAGSAGRPQEAINEARCLITDLVSPLAGSEIVADASIVVQLERVHVALIIELPRPMSDVVLYEVSTDVQRYSSAVVFREAGAGAAVD